MTLQSPDPLGGAMAAGLIVAALRQRRLTGKGVHIDFSQRENVTSILGPLVLDYQMNGRVPEPRGNRHPYMAPHGAYPCTGEDGWVTIAVRDDQDWVQLCRAIGRPELETDERFATISGRHEHHDALDEILAEWSSARDKHQAADALQAWGVPAAPVNTSADVYADRHLAARGFWDEVDDPEAGHHRYPGRPFQLSRTPLSSRLPTPTLGEHNDYVLKDILGMSDDEVASLVAAGIVANEPTEDAKHGRL
ncbi:MAG: CoA transferase, partial [Dehalococcoidia bacterium]